MLGYGFIAFAVAAVICAISSEPLARKIGRLGAAVLITAVIALLTLEFYRFTFTVFNAAPDCLDVSPKPPVIAKPEASRTQDDDPVAALEKRCDIFAREIERLKTSNAELMYRTSALAKLSGRLASLSDKGMEMQVTQAKIIAKLAKEAEHRASPGADTILPSPSDIPQTTKYLCPQPGNPGMFSECSDPLVYPPTVAPVYAPGKP
jgi:hypothetical protein